uniref:Uncharacterized protein n=1 Tax=Pseudochlorodesmis sp. HV01306a TaxID=2358488 RepID=A0A386AY34_9CHLO|nr:hypothetical protein [Pseudochlorodesmis sp. HV01306a]
MKSINFNTNFNTGTNVTNVLSLHESRQGLSWKTVQRMRKIDRQPQNADWVSLDELDGLDNFMQETYQFYHEQTPKTAETCYDFFEDFSKTQKELKKAYNKIQQDKINQIQVELELFSEDWEMQLNTVIDNNEKLAMEVFQQELAMEAFQQKMAYQEVVWDSRAQNLVELIHIADAQEEALDSSLKNSNLDFMQEMDLEMLPTSDPTLLGIELDQKLEDLNNWEADLNQSFQATLEQQLNPTHLSNTVPPPVEVRSVNLPLSFPSNPPNPPAGYTIKISDGSGGFGNNGGWGGFGGNNGGNNDGGWGGSAYLFIFSGVLFLVGLRIIHFATTLSKKALNDINQFLAKLNSKNPKKLTTKIYTIFYKTLAIFIALFTSPETLVLALRTLGGPRVQTLLRIFSFLSRGAIAASLFLGGAPFLINWYQHLLNFISPVLDKTINILAGPHNVSLQILFIEKICKCFLASLCSGGVCVFINNFKVSKTKIQNCLFILGFSYGFYFILTDFIYIRQLATRIAAHNLVVPLLTCQLGRMSLVVGLLLLIRPFIVLPGTSAIFIILLYGLGVYSLAFSASPNLFPK